MRVNVGCGQTPVAGWMNYDNSVSVLLARTRGVSALLGLCGVLSHEQRRFVDSARSNRVRYANAVRHIPLPDGSVDVLYSSHMIEHLDRAEVVSFLREARRVLSSCGIIRIACPDLRPKAEVYLASGDADAFIESMHVCGPRPQTLFGRLSFLLVGPRRHQWMYDGASLCRLLLSAGFADVSVAPAGTSRIPDPGSLDLRERVEESVYVEAMSP